MKRTIVNGNHVKVVDEVGVEHDGLATQVWGNGVAEYDDQAGPAINVVYVSNDEKKTDQYGQQKEHLSSCMHKSKAGGCPGRYWWQP